MIAFLMAATMGAAALPATATPAATAPTFKFITLGPTLPETCVSGRVTTLGPNGAPIMKLNELPPGVVEHAVWRTVNGCPVREVLFAGQTYYIEGANPQLEEQLQGRRIVQH